MADKIVTCETPEPITEVDLSGMPLDEYFMDNCKIDRTLKVSKPDATLLISRETSRSGIRSRAKSRSSSRAKSRMSDTRINSLVISATGTGEERMGAISKQSSVLSIGSILSEDEAQQPNETYDISNHRIENKQRNVPHNQAGENKPRTVVVSKVLMGDSKFISSPQKNIPLEDPAKKSEISSSASNKKNAPSTAAAATRVSREWRKQLGISTGTGCKQVIPTRTELRIREWLKRQLQQYQVDRHPVQASDSISEIKKKHRRNRLKTTTVVPQKKCANPANEGARAYDTTPFDVKYSIYREAFKMYLSSPDGQPYRDIFTEYQHLHDAELSKVQELLSQIKDLRTQVTQVEENAKKSVTEIYRKANLENKRLKDELHDRQTEKNTQADLALNRAVAAEEQLLDLRMQNNILESQRTRLLHVHDILLKYFKMHAKWKSVGEDENVLVKLGLSRYAASGQKRTEKRKRHKKRESKRNREKSKSEFRNAEPVTSLSLADSKSSRSAFQRSSKHEDRRNLEPQNDRLVDDSDSSEGSESSMDEIDASVAASVAAADAVNRQAAAHEHELAEWKQVHLSLQSISEAHMGALSDITEMTKMHSEQLEKAHQKIELLERENAELLKAKARVETPVPQFGSEKTNKESTEIAEKEENETKVQNDDEKKLSRNVKAGPTRLTNYQERKLKMSADKFKGLAPIVVDILQRRPLPALDKDAVIIVKTEKDSENSLLAKGHAKPRRPAHILRRHSILHSHNENSSFAAAKRRKAEKIRARARHRHFTGASQG